MKMSSWETFIRNDSKRRSDAWKQFIHKFRGNAWKGSIAYERERGEEQEDENKRIIKDFVVLATFWGSGKNILNLFLKRYFYCTLLNN